MTLHQLGQVQLQPAPAGRQPIPSRRPAEDSALLQGVVACGHYGTGIGVYYSSAQTAHYRCRSRLDQTHTPRCRSVSAALVDPIVERRLLEIVTTDQIALSVATEAALAAQSAQQPQLPNTSNLEALAADLRRL